ncbi:MAG: hypothetical protein IIY29_07485 [Firmicutes bacterium]|nr:hypothetical protein [Bacillota bacterium]
MQNKQSKWKESLQGLRMPASRKKAGVDGESGENRDSVLKGMKRDELLEILVEVYRENENLKEKLSETEKLLEEYKSLVARADASAGGLEERLSGLEESQREQLELLRQLAAQK